MPAEWRVRTNRDGALKIASQSHPGSIDHS